MRTALLRPIRRIVSCALVSVLSAGLLTTATALSASPASAASPLAATITAGTSHSCSLRNGSAYCWGSNANGQLGNSSTISSPAPVAVYTGGVLSGVTLTQISAGNGFTCALASSGAAYCWGGNANGELGNNSTAQSNVPVAVSTWSGNALIQISPGSNFTCALAGNGAAYCWGGGLSGQLGNNSLLQVDVPVAVNTAGVLAGKVLTQISAGANVNDVCALDSTGTVYCWGINLSGQLGNPDTGLNFKVPVAVQPPQGTISGGTTHACTIRTGAARCWGDDTFGELGNNSTAQSNVPVAVTTSGALGGQTLIQVTVGNAFACALASTGAVYCWGNNVGGQLGNNSVTQSNVPVAVTTSGVLSGLTLTQLSTTP